MQRKWVPPLSVITFEPHPRRSSDPKNLHFNLHHCAARFGASESVGVEQLLVVHFDDETSQLTHEQFVDTFIKSGFHAKHVTVGYDFVFGAGRSVMLLIFANAQLWTASEYQQLSRSKKWRNHLFLYQHSELPVGRQPCGRSSSLGRPWEVEGRVVRGDQRGRQIGFPTANISIEDYVEPALGVYAVWVGVEEGGVTSWHMGCANVGRRPTFDKVDVNCEVYIFDFTDDIYDKLLRVALVEFIRPEKKFDGIAQLREQIALDSHDARVLLESIGLDDLRRVHD